MRKGGEMLKITRGREGTGGREGGYRNQRELSTAGRWQTDTHTSNTRSHSLNNTQKLQTSECECVEALSIQ